MRISTKGRYAIVAMIHLAENYNNEEYITVMSISKKLDVSKIYLEQVFSLLKKGDLLISVKGSRGGYKLARMPKDITVFEILYCIEGALFEKTKKTVLDNAPEIEIAMEICAFTPLDAAIKSVLKGITVKDLLEETEKHSKNQGYMFYI